LTAALLTLAALLTALRLALLCRLVHGIENTEIVLRMLEVAFRHYPVAAAGRIAAELQILFKQLLGSPADAHVWTTAVEDMIAVQGNIAAGMMADRSASTAATPASTWTVIATTHAFHIHSVAVVLSRCGQPASRWGVLRRRPERIPTPWLT